MARRELAAGAMLAVGALLLAGCADSAAGQEPAAAAQGCPIPTGPVAIAAAGRANAPAAAKSPALSRAIEAAIAQQSYLAIIDTGGTPTVVGAGELKLTAKNGPAQEDQRRTFSNQIATTLANLRSNTPEANPLQALAEAAGSVKSRAATGTVVLADSGLQTTGALDYTRDGMLLAEPSDLATAVKAAGQLPDLTGITVVLTGIGDTAPPQASLDTSTRTRLQAQWKALVTAAGASCVYVDPMPNTQPAPTGLPAVSVVTPPPPPVYDLDRPISLRGDVLAYRDNSPELLDPVAARAALAPLVAALLGTEGRITLTGTTATGGTEADRLRLSADRAETAKQLLVAMGVDAARITTKGVGIDFPGFKPDQDDSGRQIPEVAAQNRSVIVEVVQP